MWPEVERAREMAKARYRIRKMLCYTLYCTTVVLVHLLASSTSLTHSTVCTRLVAGVGVALPLGDDHGLEVLALGHLGLDLLDVLGEVGCVLQVVSSMHPNWSCARCRRTSSALVHSSLGKS
jgi:hypothetical protein